MKQPRDDQLQRTLAWCGRASSPDAFQKALRYADLLVEEGIPAGVVGPNEAARVWERHIIDSICFAGPGVGSDWLDVGSGGGLPGIPIALCFPDITVMLLDRAGRRTEMTQRWIRILELDNVAVVEIDIDRYHDTHDTLLFRGSLDVEKATQTVKRLARGIGVFGASHSSGIAPPPSTTDLESIVVPSSVLDTSPTLLRINP